MAPAFERQIVSTLNHALQHRTNLIQIVTGPRQVGKSTAAQSIAKGWPGQVVIAAADLPLPPGPEWIETHWLRARRLPVDPAPLLVLDEVQKVTGWAEVVKALWDEDRSTDHPMRVLLLGSSALLLAKGTTESLAGRFMLRRCLHWTLAECAEAFGWDLDRWLFFGGYPGAAGLAEEEETWRAYVSDSLVETVLARDVLSMQTITKPTLLRHLFALAARFPAQILSYNKMLGQLQDAGNTTTLASYLRLLETAFLVTGLERFSRGRARSRGSSPKLILWNNALVSALNLATFEQARSDPAWWGHMVENAVGAHLINHLQGLPFEVSYWRHRNDEVDFVVESPKALLAIEVKSGRPGRTSGLKAFRRKYPGSRLLVVGTGGMPLNELFATDPKQLL